MKKILLVILVFISSLCSEELVLNKKDIEILKIIKQLHDDTMMRYTLMAIAIKESSIGKNMINSKSNDYGLFQANIKTILNREKVKDTPENREYYSNKLLTDVRYATKNAIIEIKYWLKVHKKNWFKAWASYNTGWRYKGNTGKKYSEDIAVIIHTLRNKYKL
jgi:hypothetical protein